MNKKKKEQQALSKERDMLYYEINNEKKTLREQKENILYEIKNGPPFVYS